MLQGRMSPEQFSGRHKGQTSNVVLIERNRLTELPVLESLNNVRLGNAAGRILSTRIAVHALLDPAALVLLEKPGLGHARREQEESDDGEQDRQAAFEDEEILP